MKKLNLLKTLHTYLKANDIESFMIAAKAIMAHNMVIWNDIILVQENWTKYGFSHNSVEEFFMYEVDSPAMDKYFWRFQELCETCMDFRFIGITASQPVF